MAGFSTSTTVENRATSARLYKSLYRDGTLIIGTTAFDQLNDKVANLIKGSLKRTYGTTEIDTWSGSDIPDLIIDISDDLLLWEMRTTNPQEADQFRMLRDDAFELLRRLADEADPLELYDASPTVSDDMYDYDTPDSDFDDFED